MKGIYGRNFTVQDIDADLFTHILYAFADIDPNTGEVRLSDPEADVHKRFGTDSWNDPGHNVYGCINQLWQLKRKHRRLKTLLSIGGWTYSQNENFSNGCNSAIKRENFAITATNLVKNLGFDGLDLDWEYPKSSAEAANLVDVLARCRRHLNRLGTSYELSTAAPCGPANIAKLDILGMDKHLDFWNLMAYDFAGSWSANAGHQSNIHFSSRNPKSTEFSLDAALNLYSSVPARKLVIGMPLYGRSFITDGPGMPAQQDNQGRFGENGGTRFVTESACKSPLVVAFLSV
ncbi:hypothetical protein TWF102_004627 [Orbilia oligospora]|uniref:chitinase n=1 Tax=Orbilia oligospora TaxID=2813651 RepID=A0A7C8N1S0_ORBOL|nr:hypothetical protein TWF102_004627 [Orbilia oligospora]KAF3090664.1 hypothetical protein TWF706_009801 [Orbilia oligospora]KAF3091861.1 hypothetical protein TWF103_011423 [Orbilia oligospora]